MIAIRVRDFRGCSLADISVAPIALIAGTNAAGKSSIAQAVGAALSGQAIPPGIPKSQAGVLVRTGAQQASATIEGANGEVRVGWPDCQITASGEPPSASIYAAGVASVANLPAVERVRVLAEYLRAAPTIEDLRQALHEAGGDLAFDDVVTGVWSLVERNGWDAAYTIRKDKGAELKGQWKGITGANYGSRIAAGWRPDLGDERKSDDELMAAVANARSAHERAIGHAAVSADRHAELTALAATVEDRNDAVQSADAAVAQASTDLADATATRNALPAADTAPELPCPHCGGLVVIRRSESGALLEQAPTSGVRKDPDELKKRRMAIAGADGTVSRLTGELGVRQSAHRAAERALQTALDAQQQLLEFPAAASAGDTEATRAALGRAEKRLAEVRAKREADAINRQITNNEQLLDLLAPEGLRGKKLRQVVEAFNGAGLRDLSEAAGWLPVTVDPDLALTYGGRHYNLLSASEQWRVRAVLQLAMAGLDKSAMVVLDGADILDRRNRGGLFEMLRHAAIPALVCMTQPGRERVPDLRRDGDGESYWIEAGIVEPIAAARVAA